MSALNYHRAPCLLTPSGIEGSDIGTALGSKLPHKAGISHDTTASNKLLDQQAVVETVISSTDLKSLAQEAGVNTESEEDCSSEDP